MTKSVIGLDLGGTKIAAALFSQHGRPRRRESVALEGRTGHQEGRVGRNRYGTREDHPPDGKPQCASLHLPLRCARRIGRNRSLPNPTQPRVSDIIGHGRPAGALPPLGADPGRLVATGPDLGDRPSRVSCHVSVRLLPQVFSRLGGARGQ